MTATVKEDSFDWSMLGDEEIAKAACAGNCRPRSS